MLISRPYHGRDDYALLRALARACSAAEPGYCYASVGDLDWWASDEPDLAALPAQLWLADGQPAGCAWMAGDQVDLICDPRWGSIEPDMLGWAERRRLAEAADGEPALLHVWSFTGDARRVALLERRGYQRDRYALNLRRRPLPPAPPPRGLPPGYTVRGLRGAAEVAARVEAHRDAFAPSRMTSERYAAAMALPTYRLDLDLVAEAPDGSLAAFCIVWFDEQLRLGVFEPVGCRAAYQRRGLAGAVMAEGLRRLETLGARAAYVSSLAGAVAAESLYESLGFGVLDSNQRWVRDLR